MQSQMHQLQSAGEQNKRKDSTGGYRAVFAALNRYLMEYENKADLGMCLGIKPLCKEKQFLKDTQ